MCAERRYDLRMRVCVCVCACACVCVCLCVELCVRWRVRVILCVCTQDMPRFLVAGATVETFRSVPRALEDLVKVLSSTSETSQMHAAVALQHYVRAYEAGKTEVGGAGGIAALAPLLRSRVMGVHRAACEALRVIVSQNEGNAVLAFNASCVPALVGLLESRTPAVRESAAGALHNLMWTKCENSRHCADAAEAAGAVNKLGVALSKAVVEDDDESDKLARTVIATLGAIAVHGSSGPRVLADGGAVSHLLSALPSKNEDVAKGAAETLHCVAAGDSACAARGMQ